MVDRVIKVSMVAQVASMVSGMQKVRGETEKTRDAVAAANERIAAQKQVMQDTGRAALVFGGLLAAGIAVAVKKYAEFDQAMSNVIATGDDARENQDALRQAAIDAGAATVFSAQQAAEGIEDLAKAGLSAKEILGGGLDGALALAAAGGLSVSDAATVAATSLKQFQLGGNQASHVADLLAAGAGKANGDVSDLGQALAQVGLVANGAGQNIENTVGALAAFADAGLLGSDAGTSLKTAITQLQAPTVAAQKVMDQYGLAFYDTNGQMLSYQQIAGQLQTRLGDLTDQQRNAALSVIFGNDALRVANVLYQQGATGIQKYVDQTNDAGYAAQVARTKLNNLNGDLEQLGGSIETALIKTGSGANDTLRAMVQIVTELVNQYTDLPAPIQSTILVVGGAAAAVSLLGGTVLNVVPKWDAFKDAVEKSKFSMSGVGITAGVAGLALGGLIAIVGEVASAQAKARQEAQSYADAIALGGDAATAAIRKQAAEALAADRTGLFGWFNNGSAYDAAKRLGISLDLVTDAAAGVPGALQKVQAQTVVTRNSTVDYATDVQILTDAINEQNGSLERGNEVNKQKVAADADSAQSSNTAAAAYSNAAAEASSLNTQLSQLIDQINTANSTGQDAISANLAYQDALAKVDETIQKARDGVDGYALTLDTSTQAGRDNLGMLNDLAGQAENAAQKQLALDGNTDNYISTLQASRDAIIQRAQDLGYNAEQASALADQIIRIPPQTEAKVIAETSQATQRVAELQSMLDNLPRERSVNIVVKTPNGKPISDIQLANQFGIGFASGGAVTGPGTARSDSILARLSTGEHVLDADDVTAMGGQGGVYRFRAALHAQQWRGYANGGAVQPRYAAAPTVVLGDRAPNVFNLTLYPAPGMDEKAFADKVVRRIEAKLK